MNLLKLIFSNLKYNKFTSIILILAVAVAVTLLTSVASINTGVEEGSLSRLENYEMIVGAQGSPFQLVLSTLYHYETPAGNINYELYEMIKDNPDLNNVVPISLGDNYAGYRIIGTTENYFLKYNGLDNAIKDGKAFKEANEVVIGYNIAEDMELSIGDTFYSIHGFSADDGHIHDDFEFEVTGILEKTNSSDDYYIFANYEAYWLLHDHDHDDHSHEHDHNDDHHSHEHDHNDDHHSHQHDHNDDHHSHEHDSCDHDHTDDEITAILISSEDIVVLSELKNNIENNQDFQAQAIFVNQVFRQLMNIFGDGTAIANIISYIVLFMAILAIFISLLNSVLARVNELMIYRILGSSRLIIIKIIVLESTIISLIGIIIGSIAGFAISSYVSGIMETTAGISFSIDTWGFINQQIYISGVVLLLTLVVSSISAYNIYRKSPLK